MVASDARTAITFSLSPGQAHDAPEGRKLLNRLGSQVQNPYLLMDRAYEGNETRQLALALGFTPVVPPLSTRVHPWRVRPGNVQETQRNREAVPAVEGVSSHLLTFEKLDVIFLGFISFALIFDALRFV